MKNKALINEFANSKKILRSFAKSSAVTSLSAQVPKCFKLVSVKVIKSLSSAQVF